MLTVFANVVLPVLTVAGFGYLLHRTLKPSLAALSQATLYVLAPALVFSSLTKTTLSAQDALQIAGFSLVFTGAMLALSWGVARLNHFDRALSSAFMISVLFMNAGNYGLSVALLAFGQTGLDRALVFFVTQAVLGNTFAVYLAASSQHGAGLAPLGAVLRMPMLYAGIAALAISLAHFELPTFVARATELAGDAAVPMMLLVLGMQLAQGSAFDAPVAVGLAVLLRLVLSVFVALGLTSLMGIEGLTRDVLLVLAGMPTAVFTIIVATEFNARPRFVTTVVVTSTVLSILTVTVLLTALVGATKLEVLAGLAA